MRRLYLIDFPLPIFRRKSLLDSFFCSPVTDSKGRSLLSPAEHLSKELPSHQASSAGGRGFVAANMLGCRGNLWSTTNACAFGQSIMWQSEANAVVEKSNSPGPFTSWEERDQFLFTIFASFIRGTFVAICQQTPPPPVEVATELLHSLQWSFVRPDKASRLNNILIPLWTVESHLFQVLSLSWAADRPLQQWIIFQDSLAFVDCSYWYPKKDSVTKWDAPRCSNVYIHFLSFLLAIIRRHLRQKPIRKGGFTFRFIRTTFYLWIK